MKWAPMEIEYCNGKVIYDKRGATTAKNKRYDEDHIKLRTYQCPECGGWHLTHILRYSTYGKPKPKRGKVKRWKNRFR